MKPLREITSAKNPQVLAAKALATPKGRRDQGAFLCEGEHMVGEAFAMCPQAVRALFVTPEKRDWLADKLQGMDLGTAQRPTALYAVGEHVLAALSQVKTPQGIAAVVELPDPVDLEGPGGPDSLGDRVILLENLQDPGNVGAILRTADAAGFTGCILAGDSADPFAPKALRATMGSVFRVPLARAQSGPEAAEVLKARGYGVVAALLEGEPFYERQPLPPKVCLLIGNEGAGLSPALAAVATYRYALPMRGGAESLNAAVAAAVMMYEIVNRG